MSGIFKLDDYVDVAERIREFNQKYPDGSLQSELTWLESGWLCKAFAFRSAADDRPGIGHAFEPVPGKTPYTKDSEAMNAETSAWGRAIVALGFDTKKIASRQEVQARTESAPSPGVGEAVSGIEKPAPASAFTPPPGAVGDGNGFNESSAANLTQEQRNKEAASRVRKMFGAEKFKGKTILEIDEMEKGRSHLEWVASEKFEPTQDTQKHFKQACLVYLGLAPTVDPDADIPF